MRSFHQLIAAFACAYSIQALVININIDERKPVSLARLDQSGADLVWDDHNQKLSTYVDASRTSKNQHVIQNNDQPVHAAFLVECDVGVGYSEGYLYAVIDEGVSHLRDPVANWPKEFNNAERLPMYCQANIYFEYPLDPPQLRDRVIFNSRGEYCNTVTHRGMPGGGYRVCPES